MVRNRAEVVKVAASTNFNVPDTCQLVVRTWFDAPSVGDFDGDGAADAEDGWKSEPAIRRHFDRNPPAGVPVSYLGGSRDNGHRALSLGNGKIRSTDAGGSGRVATVDLDWPEKVWGLKYAGWSETIDGVLIPMPPPPPPTRISQFHDSAPSYNLTLLDNAVTAGRKGVVKGVRNQIVAQVKRLPGTEHDTRVQDFVDRFHTDRVLRMHLLSQAVELGNRHGVVESVFNNIHEQIKRLPRR